MVIRWKLSLPLLVLGAALLTSTSLAGEPPTVTSVVEGKDPTTGRPVLTLNGKGLKKVVDLELVDPAGPTVLEAPTLVTKKNRYLELSLPAGLEPGSYELTLSDKKGATVTLPISLSNGKALPGSVEVEALSPELLADLDDASTLDGKAGDFYLDAGNLIGFMGTQLYSAFDDLEAEGKLGAGTDQVAPGDHEHSEYLTSTEADATYSPADHDHDAVYAKKTLLGAKVFRTSDDFGVIVPGATIPWDAEEFDGDECHSNSTDNGRLTCNTAGYYMVTAKVVWVTPDGGLSLELRKNGTAVDADMIVGNGTEVGNLSTLIHLDEGDYLELHVNATANNYYYVKGGEGFSRFWMVRLGE